MAPNSEVWDAAVPGFGARRQQSEAVAYVLLYRTLGAPRAYEALAVFGGILSTYWINVLWGMGSQFYWEKQQGQLQLYFAAPCSRMAILTGMAVGGIAMTTLRSMFGIFLGFVVLGVRVPPFDVGLLLLVFTLTMISLYHWPARERCPACGRMRVVGSA